MATAQEHAERQSSLYSRIWNVDPAYGTRASDVADTVLHRVLPHLRRVYDWHALRVVDFGAGDGRFIAGLADELPNAVFLGVDVYQPEALPPRTQWARTVLWEASGVDADYAISSDTLEHMPPDMVPAVLRNIARTAPHGFLRISTRQDIYGTDRGLHLHETVEPPEWWLARCREAGITPSSWRVYPQHAVEIWF